MNTQKMTTEEKLKEIEKLKMLKAEYERIVKEYNEQFKKCLEMA